MSGKGFPVNRIPNGCKHLYGSLFSILFSEIRTPDVDENDEFQDYIFDNPRKNTMRGQQELLDKKLSCELRDSIKHKTLLNPLVCRWIQDGDTYYPQLVGGDRRYRALDFLIRKKEIVVDPRSVSMNDRGDWEYSQCPADEAYESVLCQVFAVNNDLDALALSWAENKGRINLTDGHEVAEVIKLRKFDASDERILEILQQDEKWLAETENLIAELDVDTLSDLLEGRIDRGSALALANISNLDQRSKVREAANNASSEACEKRIKRLQKQVEIALDEVEIAEGSLADAEYQEDEEAIAKAEVGIKEAAKKVKRTIKERDATVPVTTSKDVRKAAVSLGESRSGDASNNGEDRVRILSMKKIMEGSEYFDALISANGRCLEGTFIVPVEPLKFVRKILNNILTNDADFASTVRGHFKKSAKEE